MAEILTTDFMQRAVVAALLVGVIAPLVGIFVVQRRLSLIGDGIGHTALAGVAAGLMLGTSPVWAALVAAVLAAVVLEVLRVRGGTSGDLALAMIFYGGIAAGVVLISRTPSGTPANLTKYLFGSILTTTRADLIAFAILSGVIVSIVAVLRRRLFAVANDEEYARASGMPVLGYNVLLSVLVAATVVVSMRVVGLLLISALMIVPNAAAQRVARGFTSGLVIAVAIGLLCSVGGVLLSYPLDTPSGGTIVLLAVLVFLVVTVGSTLVRRIRQASHRRAERHPHEHGPDCGHESVPHGDHVDYLHDGHRHAVHDGHYDEHCRHGDTSGDEKQGASGRA